MHLWLKCFHVTFFNLVLLYLIYPGNESSFKKEADEAVWIFA